MRAATIIKPIAARLALRGVHPTLAGTDLSVFVPLESVEPGAAQDERALVDYVSRLNRDDALVMCAVLNCVVSGPGMAGFVDRQQTARAMATTQRDREAMALWVKKAFPPGQPIPREVCTFFRGQLLELMRWVARYGKREPGDQQSFNDSSTRESFLRAALIAGELASRPLAEVFAKQSGPNTLDLALSAFRQAIDQGGRSRQPALSIGRGAFLFRDFMPRHMTHFSAYFEHTTGISFDDYFKCAGMLLAYTFSPPAAKTHLFRDTAAMETSYTPQFATFLAGEVQAPDEIAHSLWDGFATTGYRPILERPILRVASGQHAVLDPLYFSDHFSVSPLFKVLQSGKVHANETFGAFGYAFEDYAIEILEKIYQANCGFLVKRLYTRVQSGEGAWPEFEVDAIVNEGADLIVIEMKAAFLRDAVLRSGNPAAFLDELRRKYAVSPEIGERKKGVAQLARCITAILEHGWSGADIDRSRLQNIYPVLVVHDDRMSCPGVGTFLNRLFMEEFGQVNTRVRPLTVMTIDDLEHKESTHTFTLHELLREYTAENHDSFASLHDFMAQGRFRDQVRLSERIVDRTLSVLQGMREDLFPS